MRNLRLRNLLVLVLLVLSAPLGWAQGVTTAAMNGTITDKSGQGLPGATIIAVHTPTGTQYVAPTNSDGRFNIQNMRTGGPYTVRVTFVGYEDVARDNINLSLGQNLRLDVNLSESTTQLAEVTVAGQRDPVLNSGRTGAATTVQTEQIMRLPTINRSIQDFTRLSPQANGNSLGGRNNRYNNISIDGSVNNDLFGLAGSGTPGGQANTQPISLDAIQELQIVIAPYDVRQGGFTGGGINAITRNGTNKFEGSAYAFGRNQSLQRRGPTEYLNRSDNFKYGQVGLRLGGPIIKNKLFFFVNGELERQRQPSLTRLRLPGDAASASGVAGASLAAADSIRQALMTRYNYDPGSVNSFNYRTDNNKAFARLDWNINEGNQLTLRHNYVDAYRDVLGRSVTGYSFGSNGYQFKNTTNSTVLEFDSKISSLFSNQLIVGYQRIRDKRQPSGGAFPQVTVQTIPGDRNSSITFGGETFSNANSLNQDIVELTDNFTHYAGKHLITLGTHNEFFKFENLFVRDVYGNYTYRSVRDFLNSDPAFTPAGTPHAQPISYSLSYPTTPGADPIARFKVSQLGVYLQDEFTVRDNIKLTGGVRLDFPILPTNPFNNPSFNSEFGPRFDVATSAVPTRQVLFSPRLGFNWDVFNDLTTQVRGGTGIFTGRPPYVWISNQYGNTGVNVSRISSSASTTPTITSPTINFSGDPNNQPSPAALGLSPLSSEIDVTAKNFKFPQQFRSNLAVDRKLPGDVVLTLEGIYSRTVNDILYKDINLKAPTGTAPDGRPFYNGTTSLRKINPTYTNVILLDNTSQGYTYQLTAQLRKTFNDNLSGTAAYTYGKSKDVNSGGSSQAYSNWRFNQVPGDPNNPPLTYSNYDLRHRIIGSLTYRQAYANNLATGISLFYTGQSGTPYTFLYNGDVNGDGERGNDLLYLPADLNTLNFAANGSTTADQVKQQFIDFVDRDSYLKTRKGEFADRNGARTPWTHQVDVRVLQDFYFTTANNTRHTLEVTFDVFNVGNLLSKNWGRQYFVSNQSYSLLGYSTKAVNGVVTPTYTFNNIDRAYQVDQINSRWQGQLGLRYSFN